MELDKIKPMSEEEKRQVLEQARQATDRARKAKLALSDAAEDRALAYRKALESGVSIAELAAAVGVSRKMVYKVIAKK